MHLRFLLRLALLRSPAVLAASAAFMGLGAQGVTTAAIEGRVRGERLEDVDGAFVHAVNRSTGYAVELPVRGGRYALQGLEVGGPYSVVVRRLGYRPAEHHDVFLTLGQRLQLDVVLVPVGQLLDPVRVIAAPDPAFSRSRTGVGTTISDAALRRLPTRNRDLYEFVQLTPEVSSRLGISGGGVNPRLNSYLVDGVSDRALQGNGAAGGASGGKAISIEAVKEYQVLLSPYDVRHGDFAGALVNAVTKSGTNRLSATAFANASNEGLARETPFLRSAPYDRAQFGFAVGGPVVRNRAHFFVATEFQRLTAPAKGPYVGQPTASEIKAPVADSVVARFADILRAHGLEPGSAGPTEVGNPLVNLFGRIDVALPEWRSRFVLRHNYGRVRDIRFSRDTSAVFPLSSYGLTQTLTKQALAALFYTNLPGGALNELVVGYSSTPSVWTPNARSPVILVTTPHVTGTGPAFLRAGTHESAQGISLRQETAEIADNLTIPLGADHQLALGARVELFRMQRAGVLGSYGSWRFSSLDSLRRGEAERFVLTKDLGSADAPFRGAQLSVYAADERQVTAELFLTFGLRADLVTLTDQPPDNALVESLFRRRTSAVPSMLLRWSPRIGFNWDVRGNRRSQLRGGAGIFAGRPPLGWLHSSVYNYGSGIGTLTCGSLPTDLGRPPQFVPDYRNQPEACANERGFDTDPGGPVNLVNGKLQMAETLRASLAYDRMLPGSVVATIEGLYTRGLADFLFVNLNLAGPQATDRHGRVLYGTIDAAGRATQTRVSNEFSEVIDLRNQSKNHSLQLSARLTKRFSDRLEASTSYSYSRVRDVQTPLSGFQANMNWQNGRVVSARHEDVAASTSALDLPHRVVVAGTYTLPWRQWVTDVSVYYVGESGSPFTDLASAGPGRGDLNADGTNANDPIYVPRSASDTAEIIFAAPGVAAQQAAFQQLIMSTECMRRQRGRIMARNSCRSPWVHVTNASLRQSLPAVRGHLLALQLDVFNVLNLLDKDWGHLHSPNVALLEQVAQTAGPASQAQPVFRYDFTKPRFDSRNIESSYQLQIGLRYTF